MPATVPAVDQELYAAFRAGDERALERLFLTKYVPLLDIARHDVEDPMRAARVVETAVLRAWHERDQFEAPYALDTWLEHAVREGAFREKGRVAALHRFEAHEGVRAKHAVHEVPTPEQAWAHVASTLHAPAGSPEQRSQMRAEAKHHAAEHMAAIAQQRRVPAIAIAGLGLAALAVIAVLFIIPAVREDSKVARALGDPNVREVTTTSGQRGSAKLDDGSTVTLGPDSRITIPPAFPSSLRAMGLDGTASFAVAPNGKLRFIVRTGRAKIVATGTAFDVSAFPSDSFTTVRVREGSVEVATASATRTLKQGEAIAVSRAGAIVTPPAPAVDAALGWTGGRLMVTGSHVREVLPLMKRWYDLTIVPTERSLLDRSVTMSASLDSSQAAIDALQRAASVLVEWDGNKWLLRDVATKKGR